MLEKRGLQATISSFSYTVGHDGTKDWNFSNKSASSYGYLRLNIISKEYVDEQCNKFIVKSFQGVFLLRGLFYI